MWNFKWVYLYGSILVMQIKWKKYVSTFRNVEDFENILFFISLKFLTKSQRPWWFCN